MNPMGRHMVQPELRLVHQTTTRTNTTRVFSMWSFHDRRGKAGSSCDEGNDGGVGDSTCRNS